MADALLKNKKEWKIHTSKSEIRNTTRFELHSADSSKDWFESTRNIIPEEFDEIIRITHSPVEIGEFNNRQCHYYLSLPITIPDYIY